MTVSSPHFTFIFSWHLSYSFFSFRSPVQFNNEKAGRYELRHGQSLKRALEASGLALQSHKGVCAVLRQVSAAEGQAQTAKGTEPVPSGDRMIAKDVGAFVSAPGARDQW